MVIPPGMAPVPGGYALLPRRPAPPELILLPGIEGDSRVFLHQLPLARRRGVLALDLPAEAPSLHAAAVELLARIPSPRFLVFGASLGGLVGWAMSLAAPERVAGLVTLGTLPGPAWVPPGLPRQLSLVRRLPRPLFSLLYRRRIAARLREEGVREETASWLLSGLPGRDVLAGRLEMILRWGLAGPPAVPSMWLRGQSEREAGWRLRDATAILPGAMAQPVPGGHRAHLTHPTPLHGFVEHFARGLR